MDKRNNLEDESVANFGQSALESLKEIAQNIRFGEEFSLHHTAGAVRDMSQPLVQNLLQLPVPLRDQYLNLQLRSFLYTLYFKGAIDLKHELTTTSDALMQQIPENDASEGPNQIFLSQLQDANGGKGYFDPGWEILRLESNGRLAVYKDQLTLHVLPDWHLPPLSQSADVGDTVAIRMPHNFIEPGFYVAIGNAGLSRLKSQDSDQLIEVYFNFSPEGAIAILKSLSQHFNQLEIPFLFKILYNPSFYKRWDSGILRLERSQYLAIAIHLKEIYTQQQSQFKDQVPLFTKRLAPGLGLAEVPIQTGSAEDFGRDRYQLVANGLLAARQEGDESVANRMNHILRQFSQQELNWQMPYLNSQSEDIYAAFGLK